MALVIRGYWRSGTSHRTRIALELKGLEYRQEPVDLRAGAHKEAGFTAQNPQGLVPVLETPDGAQLSQSMAIIEWLEETYPDPALLPAEPTHRAIARSMADLIACDVHPLNNLRVLKQLVGPLGASEEQKLEWIARWIQDGFAALETLVERHGGDFCYADTPGIADCCLIPQIYSARRFGVDIDAFPRLLAIDARASEHEAFIRAAPENQPDAD